MTIDNDPFSPLAVSVHEAAHAVVAEQMMPGSVILAALNVQRGKSGKVLSAYVDVYQNMLPAEDWVTVIYAGRWADREFGVEHPSKYGDDLWQAARRAPDLGLRGRLSKRSHALVVEHKESILKVAHALAEKGKLWGNEVRKFVGVRSLPIDWEEDMLVPVDLTAWVADLTWSPVTAKNVDWTPGPVVIHVDSPRS